MDINSTSSLDSRFTSAFLVFNCSILIWTLLLGLPGNLWVCWLVYRTKSLQNCNNALLVSLATSDLLKCSVDTPLFLFSSLWSAMENQPPAVVCSIQQFTYSLCNCVQLLTLVSISVERFHAIAFPFRSERRRLRACFWILSIWTCGFILAAVSLVLSEKSLFHVLCGPRDHHFSDPFGPYVLVPLWGLCLVIIVIHYGRIFKVVQQHRKKVFCSGIEPSPTVSKDVWAWKSDLRPGCSPMPQQGAPLLVAAVGNSVGVQPTAIVGAVCPLTPGSKERRKKHMEGKVAQRFGYIIIAFTLFWLPIVLILLVRAVKGTHSNPLLMELETSAMVLTCVQAAVDPLIYTLVTQQFRSELRKMFTSVRRRPQKLR